MCYHIKEMIFCERRIISFSFDKSLLNLKMITLKDLALAANMSVTQVSRALNNKDDVSEETKKRIQQLANDMGYIKNITAKNLAMSVSNEIALVLKGFEVPSNSVDYNPIYPILCGVNKVAVENEQTVVVHIIPDNISNYVHFFRNKGISKAILFGFDYDDERLGEVYESNIQCVFIDVQVNSDTKGCVVVNNTLYSTKAVEELLKSGKKNIAMISGTSHALVSLEREAGYKIALEKSGKKIYEIFRGNFNRKDAKIVTKEILSKYPEIDGIFCASDYMALGCMEALQERGKKIPDDVGLIGFDNIPISKYTTPPLSTVEQDDYLKGIEATKMLVKMSNGKKIPHTKTLDCEIIKRESI